MGKTLVIFYLLCQHCYFFKRQIVGKGHKTKANKSNGDYSCQRVHPHVSEAHCGYTSFHKYVIRIIYLKLFCEVTLNKSFQLSLLKLYSYKLFQVYLVLVKFSLLQQHHSRQNVLYKIYPSSRKFAPGWGILLLRKLLINE